MRIRGIGLCVLLVGNAVSQEWADFFAPRSETEIASWAADFKNPEKLKEALKKRLLLGHVFPDNKSIPAFKDKFGVPDESIRVALQSICQEATDKAVYFNSVEAMSAFVDEQMKQFLSEAATGSTTQPGPRQVAIWKYLPLADAAEVRDFFVHFLTGKAKFDEHVKLAVRQSIPYKETDRQKREAFTASLRVAAAQEADWKEFQKWDWILMDWDKDYESSRQRVELLKKHVASEPADAESHQITTLRDRLAQCQSRATFTDVSTNLADLIKLDFRKPQANDGP